jgi:hypothetical protein
VLSRCRRTVPVLPTGCEVWSCCRVALWSFPLYGAPVVLP